MRTFVLLLASLVCLCHHVEASVTTLAFAASTETRKMLESSPTTTKPPVEQHQKQESAIPIWQMALAGGVATFVGDAAVHPIDCIKTLQQSDEGMMLSFVEASRLLWNEFGLGGFYRGLGMYLLSDTLGGSFKFATYESLKAWSKRKFSGEYLTMINYACAAFAFVVASFVLIPGEFLKQQLQMGYFDTFQEAMAGTFQTNGLLGFFTGYDGVCLRDVPYTALELGLYDNLKSAYLSRGGKGENASLGAQEEIVAAAITGGIAGYVTTPLDTIKTKLMVDHYSEGFIGCLVATAHDHGLASLFSGGTARVLWLVPFTALYLPLFDALKRQLIRQKREKQ